ncbi:hypothetical protein CFN78_06740 [Amycolatopsis antarctica]|uniref:Uncharacterized protein n=1 Tax=Amycolatopsis antarctica TaxID=1854586 RepID=A0A263D731_9PSEU|nr:hypothetical protein [Amycolatopsis antarctica]OZM73979.1 hypothetical protein CFN78_06740 [Amycolatopsis antarctica]
MIGSERTNERVKKVGIAVMVVFAAATGYITADGKEAAVQEKQRVEVQAIDLADRTLSDCSRDDKDVDPATCQKAAEVKREQVPVTVNVPRRSDAELRTLIVTTIRDNPGLVPAAAPGEPAPPIDYDEIVRRVRALTPDPPPGPAGAAAAPVDYPLIVRTVLEQIREPEDGADGRNAFCFDNPTDPKCVPPKGDPGAKGADGRGILSRAIGRNTDGVCVERTTYTAPPTVEDIRLPDAQCEPLPAPPPASETPAAG